MRSDRARARLRTPRLRPASAALLVASCLLSPSWLAAQEESHAPQPQFDVYQLVLLMRPAQREEIAQERVEELQRQHLAHLTRMGEEGHLVAAGPFGDQDDERYRGLALYRVGSVEEARRLAEADPAVRAGRLEVEVMSWYTLAGALAFPLME